MGAKPRLRWKKDPQETGLSAVARDPAQRPSELHDGTRCYATVYSHGYHALSRSEGWYCLNPFEFRAGLERGQPANFSILTGLNPFEFRAGLEPFSRAYSANLAQRLNPFEFRAGLEPGNTGE